MYINKAELAGLLGQDPVLRQAPNGGTQFVILNVCVKSRKGMPPGQVTWEDTWYKVAVWGNDAIVATNELKKGDNVYFEGKWKARIATDAQGQQVAEMTLNATVIRRIVDIKYKAQKAAPAPVPTPAPAPRPVPQPQPQAEYIPDTNMDDEDLPF
jgi:single-strand DNA-binding protein